MESFLLFIVLVLIGVIVEQPSGNGYPNVNDRPKGPPPPPPPPKR